MTTTPSEALDLAKKHIAQARTINDEFEGRAMPAEAARQMAVHLDKADGYRRQADLHKHEAWLSEPQYKHDMTGGSVTDAWGVHVDDESKSGLSAETVRTFAAFVRSGGETKAALVEDSDGQKLLPSDFIGTIVRDLARDGVIRGQATVRPTNRRTVDLGAVNIAAASWGKLELGDANSDGLGSPPSDKSTITVWDLNALVKIGRDEMEDSDAGLVEVIRDNVVAKLAEQEDDAFASGAGDASKQPYGFSVASSITQGVTAATNATVVPDDLRKVVYAVPAWARKNGAYYAHSSVEQAAALLKDTTGNYIWRPPERDGKPATYDGRPWYTLDGLPSMTTTGTAVDKSLFFGDMRAAYLIADRRRFTVDVLRERFIDAGQIGILFTHRVGGDVIRPKALAWLKL